jgi:hypothetical protein
MSKQILMPSGGKGGGGKTKDESSKALVDRLSESAAKEDQMLRESFDRYTHAHTEKVMFEK